MPSWPRPRRLFFASDTRARQVRRSRPGCLSNPTDRQARLTAKTRFQRPLVPIGFDSEAVRLWPGRCRQCLPLDEHPTDGSSLDFNQRIRNGEIGQVTALGTAVLPFQHVIGSHGLLVHQAINPSFTTVTDILDFYCVDPAACSGHNPSVREETVFSKSSQLIPGAPFSNKGVAGTATGLIVGVLRKKLIRLEVWCVNHDNFYPHQLM